MTRRNFEELAENPHAQEVCRYLNHQSPWFDENDLFECLNDDLASLNAKRKRDRRFQFDKLLDDLWAHGVVQRCRLPLFPGFTWTTKPLTQLSRKNVELTNIGLLEFEVPATRAVQYIPDIDPMFYETPDCFPNVRWLEAVYIYYPLDDCQVRRLPNVRRSPAEPFDWSKVTRPPDPENLAECYINVRVSKIYMHYRRMGGAIASNWRCNRRIQNGPTPLQKGWLVETAEEGVQTGLYIGPERTHELLQEVAAKLLRRREHLERLLFFV